ILVTLLRHIYDIFIAATTSSGDDLLLASTRRYLLSDYLCAALNAINDAPWSEWRGIHGDRPPRPITQPQLAVALRWFGIRPQVMWQPHSASGSRSNRYGHTKRGYYFDAFIPAWRGYCEIDVGEPSERPQEFRPRLRLRRD